jgi:glycosyltransferase involved in cell wall biosynthesis
VSCSLLISTYNWPEALGLCLRSVESQNTLPTEIIIADDGSAQPTKDVVDSFRKSVSIPVRHIWHPDEGFRLAAIRNKGIAAAETEYIIQIDGDLILHPYFIRDHLELRRPGYFVTGSRVLLSSETTRQLIANNSIDLKSYNVGQSNFLNGLRNRTVRNILAHRYKTSGRHKYYVKGCNMAFWRKDLLAVNGYNEAFTGWGREDSEIAIRLMNAGIEKQFMKMGGICYHLYHKVASREMEARNIAMMEDAITHKTVRAAEGISKYTSS